MPESFAVQNLILWTPAADNPIKGIISFQYTNNGTGIDTPCHYNATSVNVGPDGLAERYACDNTVVQFIWQSQVGTNGSLTMIEKACPNSDIQQQPISSSSSNPLNPNGPKIKPPKSDDGVSPAFFASLERLSRLVDITYCVGTTGVSKPFSCASRCKDFPTLQLVRTWNTGILMSDSCGYIAVDHSQDPNLRGIVVAFRGTYSLTNTIVDLSTVPQEYVPYPEDPDDPENENGKGAKERRKIKCNNCTVHMGFMESWRMAREVVLPSLKSAREKHPGYPVRLLGHSLGGAVAALAALELKVGMGWDDVIVTTFGEPRIGNQGLVDYLDEAFGLGGGNGTTNGSREDLTYRRVTHTGDPVPLLPLTEWGFRSHAGEVFITKSDLQPAPEDLRICSGDNDLECLGGAEADTNTWGWLGWVIGRAKKEKQDEVAAEGFPARFKLWQLLFAHRDYFWRLGLCLPGGDPVDWGREKYNVTLSQDINTNDRDEMRDL
ncbi:Alpha/Beta hydrolase protein [Podospora fimiseda]|uniref:Alpha/Beta hydrolase protein n=1 Tax=Podospora fimiseda TaxID=252190 RepID=A0AAN7H719_9PEZI|nr:Alpha/Beta hydrolase protein [Podospora fimiseda]